jgi:hypothetical protein
VVVSALGLDHVSEVRWPKFDMWSRLLSFLPLLCFALLWAMSFHVLFFFSWPNYDVFPYITYKTKDSTKTMEIVSIKALSTLFW